MNKVVISLAPADTDSCLAALNEVAGKVDLAEIRLDLMNSFNLGELVSRSPCRLIFTCRSVAEGGSFPGSEQERLNILVHAMRANAAYVDVEWNSIGVLAVPKTTNSRLIVSRHWLHEMPADLPAEYGRLRGKGYCIKLVGYATEPKDVLPALSLLQQATTPIIAIAMGSDGELSRLLAPCFDSCFLTYAKAPNASPTASGQFDLWELLEVYHLDKVGSHTQAYVHLVTSAASAARAIQGNLTVTSGERLHVAQWLRHKEGASCLMSALASLAPRIHIQPDFDS